MNSSITGIAETVLILGSVAGCIVGSFVSAQREDGDWRDGSSTPSKSSSNSMDSGIPSLEELTRE